MGVHNNKWFLFLALFGGVSSSFAQSQVKSNKSQSMFEQGYTLCSEKFPAAYNAPAQIDVCGSWDLFLSGSFIYWWVGQEGMDLGIPATANSLGPIVSQVGQTPFYSDQSWHPGFKIALGTNLGLDGWVAEAEYTWMHEETTTSPVSAPTSAGWFLNSWYTNLLDGFTAQSMSSKWKVNFDLLDLIMSRPSYQGRALTLAPYGGVRAFWLRQVFRVAANHLTSELNGVFSGSWISHNRAKSWAVGLTSGMKSHWMLGRGFRIEGDASFSLLYNRYTKISSRQDISTFIQEVVVPGNHIREHATRINPMLDVAAGFGWGSYLDRQNYHIDLLANWEFLLLWNQNQMRRLTDQISAGTAGAAGDLYMQGITVTLRLDF